MIALCLLSAFILSKGTSETDNGGAACTQEYNPGTPIYTIQISIIYLNHIEKCFDITVCCPDPKQEALAPDDVNDYRQYGNVCEFGYGKDEDGISEDPIACGYGIWLGLLLGACERQAPNSKI